MSQEITALMEETFGKTCKRFKSYKFENELSNVLAFTVLKDAGCTKRTAINFLTKRYCKHDASVTNNGPGNYKILKTIHDQNFIRQGWDYNDRKYEVPGTMSFEEINQDHGFTTQMNQQLVSHMSKFYQSYDKMKNFNAFVTELKEKFDLKSTNKKDEQLKQVYKKFIPKIQCLSRNEAVKYNDMKEFTYKDTKFVELAGDLYDTRKKKLERQQNEKTESIEGDVIFNNFTSRQELNKINIIPYKENPNIQDFRSQKSEKIRDPQCLSTKFGGKIKRSILTTIQSNRYIKQQMTKIQELSKIIVDSNYRVTKNNKFITKPEDSVEIQAMEKEVVKNFFLGPNILQRKKHPHIEAIELIKEKREQMKKDFYFKAIHKGPKPLQMQSCNKTLATTPQNRFYLPGKSNFFQKLQSTQRTHSVNSHTLHHSLSAQRFLSESDRELI